MVYRSGFDRLLHSRKFWITIVAVAQTVIFQFVPGFPEAVWISINALAGVLIAALAVDDISTPTNLG